jgi:hypothetical protein
LNETAWNRKETGVEQMISENNRKDLRSIIVVALLICSVFAIRHVSHQYYLGEINKAGKNLSAKNADVRLSAIETLSKLDEPEAKIALISALKNKDSAVRAKAAEGLGCWIDDRALAALPAVMKDKNKDVRRSAAWSLSIFAIGGTSQANATAQQIKSASAILDKALKAKDYPAIAGAIVYFIYEGRNGTEPILISALNACGTKEMAELYLNCGNKKLEAAGKKWAQTHHFTIVSQKATWSSAQWGQGVK